VATIGPAVVMDDTNWALLDELQRDARLTYSELSRRVHLSAPAVAERVRRMEEAGIVVGYHARVDPNRLGWAIQAIVRMSCHGPRCVLRDPDVRAWPEVVAIDRVTGDSCSVLRVVAPTVARFEDLIDRLAAYGRPESAMVLSTVLDWKPLSPAVTR
jgi:Lrp/AsnC family transcriptional regulator, leucine-responsive regulatory protein